MFRTSSAARAVIVAGLITVAPLPRVAIAEQFEQRSMPSYLRGPYNTAFFYRENQTFRHGAAIHFAHGKAHDMLELSPFAEHERADAEFDRECVNFIHNPPRTEPSMELYGPFTGRGIWQLYRVIDWTHVHHEQTYDILASSKVPWARKPEYTQRSVDAYLKRMNLPRSIAPFDVTMRRAAVMMKPYFTLFRNYYPQSSKFFFAAHWWHPAIYEAMMLGGNGPAQDAFVRQVDGPIFEQALQDRPTRMLLGREMMPRYARMSPESANIFDNLHMLHGIAYDIMAYEGWNMDQKRAEMERVLKAMAYQPGDENLVRKFPIPYPQMDPREYKAWMKSGSGEMGRIMMEMMMEMMPMMMPGISPAKKAEVMAQFKMKMKPGMQPGEIEGSLHDPLMKVYPEMHMMPGSMEPGQSAPMMVEMMLNGWRKKHGNMPDAPGWPMEEEPNATIATR
jgi:hypothetical protein